MDDPSQVFAAVRRAGGEDRKPRGNRLSLVRRHSTDSNVSSNVINILEEINEIYRKEATDVECRYFILNYFDIFCNPFPIR